MAQTVELDTGGVAPRQNQGGAGPDPLIGKQLLHYRVVEVIGQGGMSVVYRGRDEHLQRDVAIKVLHPFLAEKPECRARLAREARAVARLEHPHVLKVFDFSGDPPTVDETPNGNRVRGFAEGFIIAELVRGPTLKKFAEEHELWKCPEIGAMVVWQIAKALEHAHENGVVHRDLKPENVMVRDDGWLKLMDFGIAHIADQKGLTITGTLLGSPAHMAPECIDGHAADERSDLFSLGTVLYWITTGALPFEALTPHALLKQIVEGKAVPAQQRSPRISDDLARVIRTSMATKPTERYASAALFANALEEMLARSGVPPSADLLRQLLVAPGPALSSTQRAVRAAHLRRAEQLLAEGQPARALSCLSRVLADDNDDADARKLLERAQSEGGADDTDDGADGGPSTEPEISPSLLPPEQRALLATTPTGEARMTTSSPSLTVERPPLSRWAMQVGIVAVAVLLIGSAFIIANRFDLAGDKGKPEDPVVVVESGTSQGEPAKFDEVKPPPSAPVEDPKVPVVEQARAVAKKEREREVGKIVPVEPAQVTPPATAPPAAVKRQVVLLARPWADMFVDGVQVAEAKKKHVVELAPGPHTIVFRGKNAKDAERKIVVPAEGPVDEVQAELQPLPALLVVKCSEPDAFVQVAGQGAKQAAETTSAAIVIPLSTARGSIEVTVFKKGFVPFVKRTDFAAGETRTLDVVLEREPNEGAPGAP